MHYIHKMKMTHLSDFFCYKQKDYRHFSILIIQVIFLFVKIKIYTKRFIIIHPHFLTKLNLFTVE